VEGLVEVLGSRLDSHYYSAHLVDVICRASGKHVEKPSDCPLKYLIAFVFDDVVRVACKDAKDSIQVVSLLLAQIDLRLLLRDLNNLDGTCNNHVAVLDKSWLELHYLYKSQELVDSLATYAFLSTQYCFFSEQFGHYEAEEFLVISEVERVPDECLEVTVGDQVAVVDEEVDLGKHAHKVQVRVVSFGFFFISL